MEQKEDKYIWEKKDPKLQDMMLQYTVQSEESLWSKFIIL